jgi:hypothetical protein
MHVAANFGLCVAWCLLHVHAVGVNVVSRLYCSQDFCIENHELTSLFQLRRHAVRRRYKQEIAGLYPPPVGPSGNVLPEC